MLSETFHVFQSYLDYPLSDTEEKYLHEYFHPALRIDTTEKCNGRKKTSKQGLQFTMT